MKNLKEYSNEQLISLYKRYDLFVITKYIGMFLKDEERPLINKELWIKNDKGITNAYSIPYNVNFWISMRIDNLQTQYDNEESVNKQNKIKLEIEWLKAKYQAIRLFASGWLKTNEEENLVNDSEYIEPAKAFNHFIKCFPNALDELTMNDDINNMLERATDFKMYQFIYETLQYCSNDEIEYLLKFVDKGLKSQWENVDMSQNADKKKSIKITENMTEKLQSKYSLVPGQVFTSQQQLADYCGVSKPMVNKWKKNNYIEEV